jgi:hypothetical protein
MSCGISRTRGSCGVGGGAGVGESLPEGSTSFAEVRDQFPVTQASLGQCPFPDFVPTRSPETDASVGVAFGDTSCLGPPPCPVPANPTNPFAPEVLEYLTFY